MFFYTRVMVGLKKLQSDTYAYFSMPVDQLLKLSVQYKENYGKCQSFRIESEELG